MRSLSPLLLASALLLSPAGRALADSAPSPALAALVTQAASLRELDRVPVPRHFVYPVCPEDLRSLADRVEVVFFIDEKGEVQRPEAISGANAALRRVALEAISQWRFDPPTIQGKPTRVAASQVFVFAPLPNPGLRSSPIIPASWGPANWAGSASPEIYDVSKVDLVPQVIDQPPPVYPQQLTQDAIGGMVIVDFVVDTAGVVHNAFPVSSSRKEFEESAIHAVSNWKFRPGRKGGRLVNVHMEESINFSVRPSSPLQTQWEGALHTQPQPSDHGPQIPR